MEIQDKQQEMLRNKGIITASEVAKIIGDLLIAEDVITGTRRFIDKSIISQLTESKRSLLRD